MTLADLVTQYRTEHDLSMRAFAKQCGLSHAFISMIENHKNPATEKDIAPSLESLKRLAQAMGMTLHELVDAVDDCPVVIGNPETADDEEVALLCLWRNMDEDSRRALMTIAQSLAK